MNTFAECNDLDLERVVAGKNMGQGTPGSGTDRPRLGSGFLAGGGPDAGPQGLFAGRPDNRSQVTRRS
jgi:hypothetical protein